MRLLLHLLWMSFLVLSTTGTLADVSLERQFIWEEANSQMTSARTSADFLRAAETYRKLLNSGLKSGPLFYNLGTALLKAGKYEDAQVFLLRAERYMGHDPDIQQNMLLAIAHGKRNAPVALPWYRFLLFWHYGIPGPTRMTIAVCAFLCCWLALILGTCGRRHAAKRLLVIALAVLALFGSSILTSLHQESAGRESSIRPVKLPALKGGASERNSAVAYEATRLRPDFVGQAPAWSPPPSWPAEASARRRLLPALKHGAPWRRRAEAGLSETGNPPGTGRGIGSEGSR